MTVAHTGIEGPSGKASKRADRSWQGTCPPSVREALAVGNAETGKPCTATGKRLQLPGRQGSQKKTREDLGLACPGEHTRDGVPIKHRTGSGAFPADTEPDLDVDPGPIPRVHPSP